MNDKILWDIIDGLRDELNIAQDGITDLNDVVKDLQAEAIEQIEDNKRLRKENAVAVADERVIEELQAENVRLNASYIELRKEYNDNYQELRKENKELQAENKRNVDKFEMRVETLKNEVEEGRVENRRLMEQVSSNRCNSSSTHTHTIKKEIAEYMENNEGCGGARLFILPRDEFNDGEYDNTIYWDDGIE